MSEGLFGTDGVRGIPGRYPLNPEMVRRIGFVAASVLRRREGAEASLLNGAASRILVGRDSRASGTSLVRRLAQGFARAGCETIDAGIIPTPAVSYLTPRKDVLCGVVVSASHNPAEFNGIKFFTRDGFKMAPEIEKEIEDRLADAPDPDGGTPSLSRRAIEESEEYVDFLRSTFPVHLTLDGKRIAVDCANGAAYRIAPRLLRQLGAEVHAIGCEPNGSNINRGFGALAPEALRREVRRRRCDYGIALDGDADRVVFVDEKGVVCDGDLLISMAAADLYGRNALRREKVVLTVMSNSGLIGYLAGLGIKAVVVPVGDRNVTEAIEREGLSLGGESSGHIIFRRYGPTGDGLLTALQILSILVRENRPLSRFRRRYRAYPQILRNIRVDRRVPLEELPQMRRCIRSCERRLRGSGRVFVRYSGTEPLVRILVEGPDRGEIRRMSDEIAVTFNREIRTHVH